VPGALSPALVTILQIRISVLCFAILYCPSDRYRCYGRSQFLTAISRYRSFAFRRRFVGDAWRSRVRSSLVPRHKVTLEDSREAVVTGSAAFEFGMKKIVAAVADRLAIGGYVGRRRSRGWFLLRDARRGRVERVHCVGIRGRCRRSGGGLGRAAP
jgi:hypothetical protein